MGHLILYTDQISFSIKISIKNRNVKTLFFFKKSKHKFFDMKKSKRSFPKENYKRAHQTEQWLLDQEWAYLGCLNSGVLLPQRGVRCLAGLGPQNHVLPSFGPVKSSELQACCPEGASESVG